MISSDDAARLGEAVDQSQSPGDGRCGECGGDVKGEAAPELHRDGCSQRPDAGVTVKRDDVDAFADEVIRTVAACDTPDGVSAVYAFAIATVLPQVPGYRAFWPRINGAISAKWPDALETVKSAAWNIYHCACRVNRLARAS